MLLEEPDSGSIIYLVQGDVLSVRLPAEPFDRIHVVDRGERAVGPPARGRSAFEPPPAARPGAGGFQTVDFRVAGGGRGASPAGLPAAG